MNAYEALNKIKELENRGSDITNALNLVIYKLGYNNVAYSILKDESEKTSKEIKDIELMLKNTIIKDVDGVLP